MRPLRIVHAAFVDDEGKTVTYSKGDEIPDEHVELVGGDSALEPLPGEEPEEESKDQPVADPSNGQPPAPSDDTSPGEKPSMKELRERGEPFGLKFRPGTTTDTALAQVLAAEEYDSQLAEDLKGLADSRQLEIEGTGADGAVVKPDLVRALLADDAGKAKQ